MHLLLLVKDRYSIRKITIRIEEACSNGISLIKQKENVTE